MPWWVPCAKNMNSLFFAIILMKLENQKEIVLLLKPTTKSKATKWKIQRRLFSYAYSVPNGLSRWRLEGVFSWIVIIR